MKLLTAPALKAMTMLLALLSLQLTYIYYPENIFLAFNLILFLVGLHTSLTYSIQVKIWEVGAFSLSDLLRSFATVAVIALFSLYFFDGPRVFVVAAAALLVMKFLERLSFNILITRKQVFRAYFIALLVITLELLTFVSLYGRVDDWMSRFIVPSSLLAVLLAWYLFSIRIQAGHEEKPPVEPSSAKDAFAFSMHSFFILIIIMPDRFIVSTGLFIPKIDSALYLLLFSYCGALYSLGNAILEVRKPEFYQVAKRCTSFAGFFINTEGRKILFRLMSAYVSLVVIGSSVLILFPGLTGANQNPATVAMVWVGTLAFFSVYLYLSYVQIYFLSKRWFGIIMIGWMFAFGVRTIAFLMENVSLFLTISALSGAASILVLEQLDRKEKTQ